MAFYICVNGHIQALDFEYKGSATQSHPRVEKTRISGQKKDSPTNVLPSKRHFVTTVMTKTVVAVDPYCKREQLLKLMLTKAIHHIPVVSFGQIVGIISDRDLLKHPKAKFAHQVMAHTLALCDDESELRDVCQVMLNENISALPVINQTMELVGIVTGRDIWRWVYQEEYLKTP